MLTAARRHATALETISVTVPPDALEAYEAALGEACGTVGFFHDEEAGLWTVEGVKDQGAHEPELAAAFALAALVTGIQAAQFRRETAAEGWLERTHEAFPEQLVGRRFAIRGTHISGPAAPGRLTIRLDASVAFGSGEHGSTRGCLRALERVAYRRPRRILDLGTGSGILALAAARLLLRRAARHRHRSLERPHRRRQCPPQPGLWPGPVRPCRRLVLAVGRRRWAYDLVSPTSWPARSAGWRELLPAISPGAPPSWPGCWGPRRAGCSPRTGARVWCWNDAGPTATGAPWCCAGDEPAPQPATGHPVRRRQSPRPAVGVSTRWRRW